MVQALRAVFPLPADFSPNGWAEASKEEIEDDAIELPMAAYEGKGEEIGEDLLRGAEKQIMLNAVDSRWVRHLTDLDRLREGIGLQAFAQVDPLVAYKREAFAMYSELMTDIRSDIVKTVFSVQKQERRPVQQAPIARNIRAHRGGENGADAKPQTVRKVGPQTKRNDPCPCGSGKKFKNCHGRKGKGAPVVEGEKVAG